MTLRTSETDLAFERPNDYGADGVLLAQVSDGSSLAFGKLYDAHSRAVYAYAASILRKREDAEEITQDTFVLAWSRSSSIRLVDGSLLPWLLVTCRLKSLNRLRKLTRQRSAEVDISANELGSGRDEPSLNSELVELSSILKLAIERLSVVDRRAFELCVEQGMSYSEAAKQFNSSAGAMRTRISRLRATMREELKVLKGTL